MRRLIKKKKSYQYQQWNINVTLLTDIYKVIRANYEQLSANKFGKLNKRTHFLKNNLQKWIETENKMKQNMNISIFVKETKC